MGDYQFNGSVMSQLLGNGAAVPFASYLLGFPDLTTIASVVNPNTNAYAEHYAFFAQDDWKVSQSLTINYGLRWEYHPGFHDKNNNVVNFDPYYSSVINGQTVNGAVILPNQAAFANINPEFVQSIAPTPLILASQGWRSVGFALFFQEGFCAPRRLRLSHRRRQQDRDSRRIRTIH
jgi:outer membrane receptor protein involved in Fe transport